MGLLLFFVVFSAIFLLFADEMSAFFKKWYAVYWIRVTVPLVVISWMWIWNDELIPLILEWLQGNVIFLITRLENLLPQAIHRVADIVGLFILASVPAWLLFWKFSREVVTKSQKEILVNVYAFSWVFFTVLLLA
ncbi:MAG: hypothetical protein K0U37_01105 [Gammaproteobacteria bacterium]|nr:hypothetical protein [Gammaproteobacteria bacterium]